MLLLAGYNPESHYLNRLKDQVKEMVIEKQVRFLHPQTRESMADLYVLADAIISIPSSDGFSQSIYETWATGRFMILSDLPQYRNAFKDGETARLVNPGDVEGVAEAMRWVAGHPEARQAAIKAGYHRARAVADAKVETRKVLQLYDSLLSRA